MSLISNVRHIRSLTKQSSFLINGYLSKYSFNCRNVSSHVLYKKRTAICVPQKKLIFEDNIFKNLNALNYNIRSLSSLTTSDKVSKRKTSPFKISKIEVKEQSEEEIENIENVSKLYPAPKSVLNQFYLHVSQELKRTDLTPNPVYKLAKRTKNSNSWACTYHVKWPEDKKFTRVSQTKKEASTKAALDILVWLKSLNKINNTGQPLIYSVEEVKEIKSTQIPKIKLSKNEEMEMRDLLDIYTNELLPQLDKYYESKQVNLDQENQSSENEGVVEDYEKLWPNQQNNSAMQSAARTYLACEPVKLPISDYKEKIKEIIDKNRVVIVKGEPGCGKSTRVPQYVLEYLSDQERFSEGPNRIIVTEPRRIAAISLADRVAVERDEAVGRTVGYQVRLQSKFNNNIGKIMYCTTGILLRRIQSDPKLSDCSYVILDEAHERDVNTDLLMNLLRYALKENPALKLIVMSATIDTNVFENYFKEATSIHIPGFTYPVKLNFLEDIKKVNLTKTKSMCEGDNPNVVCEDVVKVIEHIHKTGIEGAILCFLPGWDEISKIKRLIPQKQDMSVLCLHSRLQDSDQRLIFHRLPPGVRKVILATNIAETSVTIDDVVHVIDTGIHKEQRFDVERGIMCMDNHWVSKSSVMQRKGRAGRVREGISYHLYPKSKFDSFSEYAMPEILRTSLTKNVLESKVYSNNMNALEFFAQLPCPPENSVIEKAVEELKDLELLDDNENLTPLGRTISNFQLEPKLSKAMVNSVVFKCATPIVDIVTIFSAETELFESGLIDKAGVKETKQEYCSDSDHISLMKIFEYWLHNQSEAREFCAQNNLTMHKLRTLAKLRQIHFDYLIQGLNDSLPISDDLSDCEELVKGVLLSGVGNILTHRKWDVVKGRLKNTSVLVTKDNHKATISSESVNHKRKSFSSDYFVYINETRSNIRRTTIVREASMISPLIVLLFKNSELSWKELPKDLQSEKNEGHVLLKLNGTNVQLICSQEQADLIIECKKAINTCRSYFIQQLTDVNDDYNSDITKSWKSMLEKLSEVLSNG